MIDVKALVAARAKAKLSQAELARRVGLKQQAIGEIERGKVRSTVKITKIAQVLGVAPHELDPDIPKERLGALATRVIPILAWVSAGDLRAADLTDDHLGQITAGDLDPKGDWIALRVVGDSMDRISPPDSIILVDRNDTVLVPNALYVVGDHDGTATYKRYRPDPMRFEPVSTNGEHMPIYPDNEPVIVGRVWRTILKL